MYEFFGTIMLQQKSGSWGPAAVAQLIRLCLPFCRPGFESQAYHLRFYQCKFDLWHVEMTNINKKRCRDWPVFFFQKSLIPKNVKKIPQNLTAKSTWQICKTRVLAARKSVKRLFIIIPLNISLTSRQDNAVSIILSPYNIILCNFWIFFLS